MKLGFFSVLTLIFITLKLTNYIAWSWGLVTMPLWIGLAVLFPVICCAIIMGSVASI